MELIIIQLSVPYICYQYPQIIRVARPIQFLKSVGGLSTSTSLQVSAFSTSPSHSQLSHSGAIVE